MKTELLEKLGLNVTKATPKVPTLDRTTQNTQAIILHTHEMNSISVHIQKLKQKIGCLIFHHETAYF